MKKLRVTRKEITKGFKNIISCNYCSLQNLLRGKVAYCFTSGKYGWNADIYLYDFDTIIVTGYNPFGVEVDSEFIKKFDDKAKTTPLDKLDSLIDEFISVVKNRYFN